MTGARISARRAAGFLGEMPGQSWWTATPGSGDHRPMATELEALVGVGTTALEEGRWSDARDAFSAALRLGETAEVLDGLGQALWWLGETQDSIDYRERAYAEFR